MTGTELSNHNAAGEPLNVLCIQDGAGYLNGHFYTISEDGVIRDVFAPHTHSSTGSGGTLFDIKRANYKNLVEVDMSLNIAAALFDPTITGGSTVVDVIDNTANNKFVRFLTAATANNHAYAELGGGRLRFGAPITLQLKYAVSANTSITYRMGVGSPAIVNAIGVGAQFGFEGCTGTDQNNRAYTSDGTTFNAQPLSNMLQSFPMGLRIDFYPSSKIVATDGLGTTFNITSNLPPVSSATNSNSVFRAGVKTLTGATRTLNIYAMRLVGDSYDSVAGIRGWC